MVFTPYPKVVLDLQRDACPLVKIQAKDQPGGTSSVSVTRYPPRRIRYKSLSQMEIPPLH